MQLEHGQYVSPLITTLDSSEGVTDHTHYRQSQWKQVFSGNQLQPHSTDKIIKLFLLSRLMVKPSKSTDIVIINCLCVISNLSPIGWDFAYSITDLI